MTTVTVSRLRENIYRLLDEVLETGIPVEIERRGRRLRIVAVESPDRLDRLSPHPEYLECDPEDVVHIDWSAEWQP